MKNRFASFISTAFLLSLLGYTIYLWGSFFVAIVMHPARALKVIVIPSLVICVIVWLAAAFIKMKSSESPALAAKALKRTMQEKSTIELIAIVYGADKSKWTAAALQTANEILKPRLFSAEGIDALERYRATLA